MATHDHFLKLDGIDGEAQDSVYKGWIDVLSFNYSATQGGTSHVGGGGGKGRVALQDMVISKGLDKASPALFQHCCSGQHITKAVITTRKAGKTQQPYYTITMTDVLVSSHATGDTKRWNPKITDDRRNAGGGPVVYLNYEMPSETITLNYSTISIAYSEQGPDGSVKGQIVKGWDAKQNKVI
jgi:type VI secretion system secreted protein Hcp